MDEAPVPISNQIPEDAPPDKKKYYDGQLGEGWLKRAQGLYKEEAIKELDALEETADQNAEDVWESAPEEQESEEDELLHNPDADYVPSSHGVDS